MIYYVFNKLFKLKKKDIYISDYYQLLLIYLIIYIMAKTFKISFNSFANHKSKILNYIYIVKFTMTIKNYKHVYI